MTDSLYSPVMPNYYPITAQTAQSAPKSGGLNFNALLGASVFGAAAGYGVYKLDYFKDPMTKAMFEESLRNGKEIDFTKSLTAMERSSLNAAKNGMSIMPESQINSLFGDTEHLTYIDYLKNQHPGKGITTRKELEKAIENAKGHLDPNSISAQEAQKHKTKFETAKTLQQQSERLAKLENNLIDLEGEHGSKNSAYSTAEKAHTEAKTKLESLAADADDAAKKAANEAFKKADKDLKIAKAERNDLSNRLKNIQDQRTKLEQEMKKIISDAKIGDVITQHGEYKAIQELTTDLEAGSSKKFNASTITDAAERRTKFFTTYSENITADYNTFMKGQIPKSGSDELTKMLADLELVKAAEAGNGLICKDMVQEVYAEASKAAGKGEKGIATAFEKLKLKLPKSSGNFTKAGLAGLGITLGLYLLNNSKS